MSDFKTVKVPSAAGGFWQDDAFLIGLAIATCVLILGVLSWRRSRRDGRSQINSQLADRCEEPASGAQIRSNRKPRCRWHSGQRTGIFRKWHCSHCGTEAFTTTGKAPAECKKGLKPKAL